MRNLSTEQKMAINRIQIRQEHLQNNGKNNYGYNIALLVDISGSMRGKKIKDAKEAIADFLGRISLGREKVVIIAFGEKITKTKLTKDKNYLIKKLNQLKARGFTPIMPAMQKAWNILREDTKTSLLVLATDGGPTAENGHPNKGLTAKTLKYGIDLKNKGVRIITIGIGKDAHLDFLKKLSSSRKDYFFVSSSDKLKIKYKEVAKGIVERKSGIKENLE
jgi:molecular chaperone DnaK